MKPKMIQRQLSLTGLDATHKAVEAAMREQAEMEGRALFPNILSRKLNQVSTIQSLMAEEADQIAFFHSGFCISGSGLPHACPQDPNAIWTRENGRFSIMVQSGVVKDPETGEAVRCGIPYGTRARLLLIHLQTEGRNNRVVNMGDSLSAFLRSLGIQVTGGENGSITAIKKQFIRIARCSFTICFDDQSADGVRRTVIEDTQIMSGMEMLQNSNGAWKGVVELSPKFHEQLREHAVPLSKRAISSLSGSSLGLDLYTLFAARLRRLSKPLELDWMTLQTHLGSEFKDARSVGRKVRDVLPLVQIAYPEARFKVGVHSITLLPSDPAVPERTMIPGHKFHLIEGTAD